jgi:hypothetical protein
MALTKCTVPTDIIGTIGTTVQERGLTTQQFKDKFDEMPEGIKTYLNDVLTVEQDAKNTIYDANKTASDAHMAETVSYGIAVTRDISVTGVQTVTVPFKAKSISVNFLIPATKVGGSGMWSENEFQRAYGSRNSDGIISSFISAIGLAIDVSNYATGTIQNVTETGFEILWAKTGAPTGTATLYIQANTH